MTKYYKLIIFSCILLGLDLFSKYLFYDLNFGNSIFLQAQLNNGIARSIKVPSLITIIISIIASIVFVISYHKNHINLIIAGFLLGGTLGNLFDRIIIGGVRDFININILNFPIFNLADIFLNIGVILFIIYEIYSGKNNPKN